jgi:hypothetical protein
MAGRSAKLIGLSAARALIGHSLGQKRGAQLLRTRLTLFRRDIERADHLAGEQLARMVQHRLRREQRQGFLENILHHSGRGNGFVNIDRLHQIVGQFATGQKGALLHLRFEHDVHFGGLAGDFLDAGRAVQNIGDNAAHLGQRLAPIAIKGRNVTKVPSTDRDSFS